MIGLLQRVARARVDIGDELRASIERGLLVLVGVRPSDDEAQALKLLERQIEGSLLLVPQFTLAADTRHGARPGFSGAAPPEQGRRLFDFLVGAATARHPSVASGVFGAHMQVSLTNDGPVTLWLET
jgi:D-aminoacyl-tRNA deacylase